MRYRFYYSAAPDCAFYRQYRDDHAAFAAALGHMKESAIEAWQGTRLVFRVSPPLPQVHVPMAGRYLPIAMTALPPRNSHPG